MAGRRRDQGVMETVSPTMLDIAGSVVSAAA